MSDGLDGHRPVEEQGIKHLSDEDTVLATLDHCDCLALTTTPASLAEHGPSDPSRLSAPCLNTTFRFGRQLAFTNVTQERIA